LISCRGFKIAGLAFTALILIPLFANASVVQKMSKNELVDNADSIVVGKVVEEYSDWDPTGKFIFTYTKIKVLDDLAGAEGGAEEVTVKRLGGKVGNREMKVHGAAEFRPGEKTVLFLNKDKKGFRRILGLSQGKFRVLFDRAGGREYAVNPADPDLHFVEKMENGKIIEGDPGEKGGRVLLDDFINDIKNKLRAKEEAK
jgi:hypothetical protein